MLNDLEPIRPPDDLASHRILINQLQQFLSQRDGHVQLIETHISSVLVTPKYAYKIKKPVQYGFVDFTTLEKRHYYCEQEFRLNQALAEILYLGVQPICLFSDSVQPTEYPPAQGVILDYALYMHAFDQYQLGSYLVENMQLSIQDCVILGQKIADYHQHAQPIPSPAFGSFGLLAELFSDHFKDLTPHMPDDLMQSIQKFTHTELNRLKPLIHARQVEHRIISGHGDLHLGNLVKYQNHWVIFDCIEFNEQFRYLDPILDIAFLSMDLKFRSHANLAICLLNAYFKITQDYQAGFALLRLYEIYRALTRAKIASLNHDRAQMLKYCQFSAQLFLDHSESTHNPSLFCFLIHGLTGTGKTTFSSRLAEKLPAFHLESDRIRKTVPSQDAYSELQTDQVYATLTAHAKLILKSGYSVILDATFLETKYRTAVLEQIQAIGSPIIFKILSVSADFETIRARVQARQFPDLAVLDQQAQKFQTQHPEQFASEQPFVQNINLNALWTDQDYRDWLQKNKFFK